MTADARVLVKFMRKKDVGHRMKYGQEMPVEALIGKLSAKYRERTYISGRRPFGVGLIVIGKDSKNKFRVYEFSPEGKVIEFIA
jgi:20S proteasome subunit alpha 6